MWVPTIECDNCPAKRKFNVNDSKSATILQSAPRMLTYGTGEVGGYPVKERVSLDKSGWKTLDGFNFLAILKAKNMHGNSADGILGLGPVKDRQVRKHFVQELFKQKIIEREMFSFNF